MIQLYFFPTPNTWKVSIMLEECDLPYTVIPVNIGAGEQFSPEFLAISPNSKVPAIVDPDGPEGPISLFESGAILVYLAEKTGRFLPAAGAARADVLQWLFWQVGGLGPMAGQAHHFRRFTGEQVPYAIERYTREVGRLYGVLDKRLQDREWIAGEYSIADIACWGWISYYEMQGQDLAAFPALQRWFRTMAERPAVIRGGAVGAAQMPSAAPLPEEARRILSGQGAAARA